MPKVHSAKPVETDLSSSSFDLSSLSLVVVDDIPEIADQTASALAPHVKRVTTALPENAVHRIRTLNPDALVVDLRYSQGTSGPRHGMELLQQLGTSCPPTVIHTASINSSDAATLSSAAVSQGGGLAYSLAMKGRDSWDLLGQLALITRTAEMITPEQRAGIISKAAERLKRSSNGELILCDQEITSLSIFIEKLRDFCSAYIGELEEVRSQTGEKTEKLNGVIQCLNRLREISSSEIVHPSKTKDLLHEIVNRLLVCDPANFPSEWISYDISEKYSEISVDAQSEHSKVCEKELGIDFNKYLLANFKEWLGELFGDPVYHWGGQDAVVSRISDPQGKIDALFQSIKGQLEGKMVAIHVSYFDDNHRGGKLPMNHPARLALGCGACFKIEIDIANAHADRKPAWKYFESSMFEIFELRREKILYAQPYFFSDTFDDSELSSFEFYLKARDLEPEVFEIESNRLAKIIISEEAELSQRDGRGKLKYYRSTIGEDSVTFVGMDPRVLIDNAHEISAVLVDGELILATGSAHVEADGKIYHYLNEKLQREDAFDLARDSLRMKLEEYTHLTWSNSEIAELLETDPGNIEITDRVTRIFSILGCKKFSAERFSSRAGLLSLYL